jgi:hypothetical protein
MSKQFFLGLVILLGLAVQSHAVPVGFVGAFNTTVLQTGGLGTGFLGNVGTVTPTPPPPTVRTFGGLVGSATITTYNITGPAGNVGPGRLLFGIGGPLYVLGGTSTWTDNGAADTIQFSLNVGTVNGGPQNGTLAITFSGNIITGGNGYSDAKLSQLLKGGVLSDLGTITYVDNSGPLTIYSGFVQAVPEPGMAGGLLLTGLLFGVRRRRCRN